MQFHYTYLLTCVQTNQLYMGVRTSKVNPEIDNYWSSSKVVKAMMKEGYRFTKQILSTYETRELAVQAEIEFHTKYEVSTNSKFLNRAKQTSTGFDITGVPINLGSKHSEETRSKMRASSTRHWLGKSLSEATRRKIAEANTGYKHPDSVKKKLSAALRGRKQSPEHIAKAAAARRKNSNETL